jgi:polyketide synthase 12
MLAERGADALTMDALAERAGVGKGTVYRRFRTRAGIFHALLDDNEREFQQQVLSGAPPLGPGASSLDRLVAYGRARTRFLLDNHDIARAALDGRQLIPAGAPTPVSREHIGFLLAQMKLGTLDVNIMATQLTAALDGPPLLYLSSETLAADAARICERLGQGWQDLVERVCRPQP